MQLEIFSDIVCPWCFVGKRRLDELLATDAGEGVSLRWRPYQLRPTIPPGGIDRHEYLAQRYGDAADPARGPSRVVEEAATVGLALDYGAIGRIPNTTLAHRVMEAAFATGDAAAQHDLADALFAAYFCEGRDVESPEVLGSCLSAVGLDATLVDALLIDDVYADDLQAQRERAIDLGISGVPNLVFAGTFSLPGVQSLDSLQQIFERARTRLGD
ncbi:MAG: DsbA family oxidoreductase [Pseudomonadota bacterium]